MSVIHEINMMVKRAQTNQTAPQPVQRTPTTQQTSGGTTASAAARMKEYRAIRARMLRDYVNRTGSNFVPPEYMKKIRDAQESYMNGK